jgi:hypothetical protein
MPSKTALTPATPSTSSTGVASRLDVMRGWWHSQRATTSLLVAGIASVVLYGIGARPSFNAAEFRERLAPSSLAAGGSLAWETATGPLAHSLRAGVEWSSGEWIHERIRNGGSGSFRIEVDKVRPRDLASQLDIGHRGVLQEPLTHPLLLARI